MPLTDVRISYATGPAAIAGTIAESLTSATVVRITACDAPLADPKSVWVEIATALGKIDSRHEDSLTYQPFRAEWWDIRYDPAYSDVYRHSATAQPLHTDNAFHADPPNGALFYCERPASRGGATTFLDGDILSDALMAEDRSLYVELTSRPIKFARGAVPGQSTVVIGTRRGRPILNWNYYRVVPGQGAEVEALRQRFFDFLRERFTDSPELVRVRLEAGQVLVFKEQRLLHGREAFEPDTANPRLIQTMNVHLPAELD